MSDDPRTHLFNHCFPTRAEMTSTLGRGGHGGGGHGGHGGGHRGPGGWRGHGGWNGWSRNTRSWGWNPDYYGWGWGSVWPWVYASGQPLVAENRCDVTPLEAASWLAQQFGSRPWWNAIKIEYVGARATPILHIAVTDIEASRELPESFCDIPVVASLAQVREMRGGRAGLSGPSSDERRLALVLRVPYDRNPITMSGLDHEKAVRLMLARMGLAAHIISREPFNGRWPRVAPDASIGPRYFVAYVLTEPTSAEISSSRNVLVVDHDPLHAIMIQPFVQAGSLHHDLALSSMGLGAALAGIPSGCSCYGNTVYDSSDGMCHDPNGVLEPTEIICGEATPTGPATSSGPQPLWTIDAELPPGKQCREGYTYRKDGNCYPVPGTPGLPADSRESAVPPEDVPSTPSRGHGAWLVAGGILAVTVGIFVATLSMKPKATPRPSEA